MLRFIELYTYESQIYCIIILNIKNQQQQKSPTLSSRSKHTTTFLLTVFNMRVSSFPMLWSTLRNRKLLCFNLRSDYGILCFNLYLFNYNSDVFS